MIVDFSQVVLKFWLHCPNSRHGGSLRLIWTPVSRAVWRGSWDKSVYQGMKSHGSFIPIFVKSFISHSWLLCNKYSLKYLDVCMCSFKSGLKANSNKCSFFISVYSFILKVDNSLILVMVKITIMKQKMILKNWRYLQRVWMNLMKNLQRSANTVLTIVLYNGKFLRN